MGRAVTSRGHLLRDPIVLGVILVNGAALALYLFPFLPMDQMRRALDIYSMVPVLVLAILAPWVGLPPVRAKEEKIFWGLWSLALTFVLFVRLIYVFAPGVESLASGALAIDVLYVLFYLSLVFSLRVKPDRKSPAALEKGLVGLEGAGVIIFVMAALVYFSFIPQAFNRPEYETWAPSLLLYWILSSFLFFTLLNLRHTSPSPRWRILFFWLAAAALCWSASDLLELVYYLEVDAPAWVTSVYLDVLWYLPWVLITITARMRTRPAPVALGKGARDEDSAALNRSLGRPGWLVAAGLALPAIHFGANLLGLLDPSTRDIRELVVFAAMAVLLGLAFVQQKALERRALRLADQSRELEEHRRLLAAALEQSPDAILIADAQGKVRYGNSVFAAECRESDSILGTPLEESCFLGAEGLEDEPLGVAMEAGRRWEGRMATVAPDGNPREELLTVAPVRGADGEVEHFVLVRRDVTYLSQLEKRFRQTQKMEALGTLAGGIAHDFNNILGIIYGHGELMKVEIDPESRLSSHLDGLLIAAERAAELVSQILTFSRQGEDERQLLPVAPTVREGLSLLRATLPSTIEIREKIGNGICAIRGGKHQLQQVLLNLGSNAAHAMGERGGVLEVVLERSRLIQEEAEALGLPTGGDFAHLFVADDGSGMEKDTADRIFDPFFTTKEVGEGTGLGLSVVHGIVTGYGGVIRVDSRPGVGTRIDIFLPCVLEAVEDAPAEDGPIPQGEGREVVVVDDEPMLVKLAEEILRSLGYRVRGFADAAEALDYLKAEGSAVSALVTDQTMPRLTGLELASEVALSRPEIAILLTTGYSETVTRERLEAAGVRRLLMKPFNRKDLGEALAGLLRDT